MKNFTLGLSLLILIFSNTAFSQDDINSSNCQDGDVIFIRNLQSTSMRSPGDKNKFNFTGIIFWENGFPMVYYAGQPLQKSALSDFIKMSEANKYTIKRLIEPALLTKETVSTMHTFAIAKLGLPYDTKEELNNENFYNAEFVWKIYTSCLGIYLGEPKEYDMASGDVKKHHGMNGSTHSLSGKYIEVRDIYRSQLLQ